MIIKSDNQVSVTHKIQKLWEYTNLESLFTRLQTFNKHTAGL